MISVACSVDAVTLLHNRQYYAFPTFSQTLTTTILLSASVNLPTNLTYVESQYLSFSIWSISLSIMSSWSIYLVACIRISFLFQAEKYSFVCLYQFIHSSFDKHLGCLNLLAIVNSAAIVSLLLILATLVGITLYLTVVLILFFCWLIILSICLSAYWEFISSLE